MCTVYHNILKFIAYIYSICFHSIWLLKSKISPKKKVTKTFSKTYPKRVGKKNRKKKGIQDLTNPRGVLKKQLEAACETSNYQASYLCLGYLHGERVGVSHVSTLEIISLK